ncbi:MAG: D-glycero-beta-D-manno-heptose 1-phosphate adenylyltransferase [Candidatus Omnitrophica bacterium]|nr:D-glycero-beta-D-manno-heptose 1-phosphate adenylyltransferase [Candidatus Omnitrophota bacterium]
MPSKLKTLSEMQNLARKLHKQGKKIVFTNGCFDVLHVGHISYLAKAKEFGDVLVVGLNRDRSIRAIKGPKRPINPEKARAHVLAALQAVDFIVLFGENTPLRLICKIQPDILVKGADWKAGDIVGANEIKNWGGAVKRVSLVKGFSTTRMIERMRQAR